jgi:hypothetical protein
VIFLSENHRLIDSSNLGADSRLPAIADPFNFVRTAQKIKITKRRQNGAEHSAPELLNSTAVAWVWIRSTPAYWAIDRDQTLGLRSVVPLAGSFYFLAAR